MNIGDNIRILRQEKSMTQNRLAELAKIAEITLSQYERGKRNPTIDIAARIADAFGVTIDYLVYNRTQS